MMYAPITTSRRTAIGRLVGRRNRGVASLIAMVFLLIMVTLSFALYSSATMNSQSAATLRDAELARNYAESGLRWMEYQMRKMNRPKTVKGVIDQAEATTLMPQILTAIGNQLAAMQVSAERAWTYDSTRNEYSTALIALNNAGATFQVKVRPHPFADEDDTLDARFLRVTAVGVSGTVQRSASVDFQIDKKIRFAIVGKVPIQLGRNTVVEGNIGMATASKYPPLLCLSDFRNLTPALTTRIDGFRQFLKTNHAGYDNRVNVENATEWALATSAGFTDTNGDGFIDEFDLFLDEFDSDSDGAVSAAEFTNPSTGKLYDDTLMATLDELGAPLYVGDVTRLGYQDGSISSADGYAKVYGTISIAASEQAWASNLASSGKTIQDMIQGPVRPSEVDAPPIKFSASTSDIFDLDPQNFDTTQFKNRSGVAAGTTLKSGNVIQNAVLSVADANGGYVSEKTPLGSTSFQATYRRPVFKDKHFKNVRIPKGLNALFDNCTFEGVTFVDMETNIGTTTSSGGMTWSKRMKSGSFSSTTVLTSTNSWGYSLGNNLRFNNCTIKGPIASDVPTAYTHFTNSWEFTGSTMFDNQEDQTATIVAPQVNIEMGSFTDPSQAPSTLVGVVVCGNIDIRGTSTVDGSIIVTGDGAGNTTLGWFGPSDGATDSNAAMPEGGFGRMNVRYNPHRALPDGINIAVELVPLGGSYQEGR